MASQINLDTDKNTMIILENYKQTFDSPEHTRKTSEEHGKARYRYRKAANSLEQNRSKQSIQTFKEAQKHLLDAPYRPTFETGYKRIQYVRYADDFVIGVTGSKEDAERAGKIFM